MHIAMWSGPRNLSTAMMYSFSARGDCAVWDEPFYGVYLQQTGLEHPMFEAIVSQTETNTERVIERCLEPAPDNKPHYYQKHMTHHMLDSIDRSWVTQLTNVFLIRHPARVIASYTAKRENPTLNDIGFMQQADLFHEFSDRLGDAPIVIDGTDIRAAPERALRALCEAIGLDFTERMLSWPAGGIVEDGPWAPHWYNAIHNSTGFAGAESDLPKLNAAQQHLLDQSLPHYEQLAKHKITF